MDTGTALAVAALAVLLVIVPLLVWLGHKTYSDVLENAAGWVGWVAIGLGIASVAQLPGEVDWPGTGPSWDPASLPQKAVICIGAAIIVLIGFGLACAGLFLLGMFLLAPPYLAFRWARRVWRIVQGEGRDYDEDGFRRHYDSRWSYSYYYRRGEYGPRMYLVYKSPKICAWVNSSGEVVLCKRDGSRVRRVPKELRESPIQAAQLPPEATLEID